MADPITLGVISGLGSAAINAFAAYKKGEISESEYRRAVQAATDLERQLKALRPDESWENINPKLLSEAAKYSPEVAAFVEENAPQLIQEAGSATEKRIQRQALQTLAAQAETGRDVISEAQQEQALFESDARAKARRNQLMESLRRQGTLGSGAGLVAQLQGEQEATRSAREETLRGTQEAEMRRRQALGQAASLAGQIRSQNVNVESANVGTMNAYNQRLANARNLYNQYASNERNRAQALNQQRQRETEQYNIGLENQYAVYNREQSRAARERARAYDASIANRMFDVREAAEGRRSAAKAQQFGDYGTAITSGIGTGLGVYGAAQAGLAQAAKTDALKAIGQSALAGAAQGLSSAGVQRMMAPEQRYNLGVNYPSSPSSQIEDIDSESFEVSQPESLSAAQYRMPRNLATQNDIIPSNDNRYGLKSNVGDVDEDGNPILPGAAKRRKIREGR
jgi:hypothetical protein